MIVECFLISAFVSEGTKLSTRTLFLDVVKASIDFLLEMDIQTTAASAQESSLKNVQIERRLSAVGKDEYQHIVHTNVSVDVTPRGKRLLDIDQIRNETPPEEVKSFTDVLNN